MTRYTGKEREEIIKSIKGQIIDDVYYVKGGDYYVIVLNNDSEFCFRYMADLI